MQLWLAALGGMILKLDHSYKVVNKVRDPSGAKQYKAVLSVMNEFCQVRLNDNSKNWLCMDANCCCEALWKHSQSQCKDIK